MTKTAQPETKIPQNPVAPQSAPRRVQQFENPQTGYLADLAAAIHQSPVVQTQMGLAEELHRGYDSLPLNTPVAFTEAPVQAAAAPVAAGHEACNECGESIAPQSEDQAAAGLLPAQRTESTAPIRLPAETQTLQLMKFERFQGWSRLVNWFQSSEEDRLLEREKTLKEFLESMEPYQDTAYGDSIRTIKVQFQVIENSTIEERDYAATLNRIQALQSRLDDVSSAIARRGLDYERANPEHVEGLVHEDDQDAPRAKELTYLFMETFSLLPAALNTADNRKIIREAIYPPLAYGVIEERDLTRETLAFAKTRVRMLRANFRKMLDRIATDWGEISEAFGLHGRLRFLHLTGSDFHNEGQSVSIIEDTAGDKVVYKPRDLTPDRMLTGRQDSAFSALSQAQDVSLPTSGFRGKTDARRGGEKYGYMQFQQKVNRLSVSQARDYYFRMGQMAVSTKLLGVTDLHQDNILTGAGGNPLIIDAEASFLPDIMMSDAWNATMIGRALKDFTIENKLTVNAFLTVPEWAQWEEYRLAQEGASLQGFITETRNASIREGGAYYADFCRGVDLLLRYVTANKNQVIRYLEQKINSVTNVRIVPLQTTDFIAAMTSYKTRPEGAQHVLDITVGDIRSSFQGKGYLLDGTFDRVVRAGLTADFSNTDIPIFHYEPRNDRIYYRDTPIGIHRPGIMAAITANVDRITLATVQQVATSLGLRNG